MSTLKKVVISALAAAAFAPAMAFATQPGWYLAVDAGQAEYSGIAGNAQQWVSIAPIPQPPFPLTIAIAPATLTQHDTSHGAYRLVTGYQFNPYFGLEAGYVDLGSINAKGTGAYDVECQRGFFCIQGVTGGGIYLSRAQLRTHGLVLGATGSWPISPQWSLMAKVGAIDAHTTLKQQSVPTVFAEDFVPVATRFSHTEWSPVYGVGVNFAPTEHWAMRGGLDRYTNLGDSVVIGKFDVNLFSLGFVYTL